MATGNATTATAAAAVALTGSRCAGKIGIAGDAIAVAVAAAWAGG